MPLITRKAFEYLAAVHEEVCISLFIPTHRAGREASINHDSIVLKNELKKVKKKLVQIGRNQLEIDTFLRPAIELLDDPMFWNHQSDGLALFITNDEFLKFSLPVNFETFNYVANHFYLKPLMPMFNGDGRFFILALTLDKVEFFEATRHSIAEVIIDDLVPSALEATVGYDYEQKSLQFRSQKKGMNHAVFFHGQGAGKEKEKSERLEFFRDVNRGLMSMLHDEDPPLVVVSQDHLFSLYQKANTYNFLLDRHLAEDPDNLDSVLLHEKTWEIVKPWFNQNRKEDLDLFVQLHDTALTSTNIQEIIPGSMEGRVKSLFVQNRSDVFGIYDKVANRVEIRQEFDSGAVALMNLAAVQTFLHGGRVYLMEEEELPASYSKMNALFRY